MKDEALKLARQLVWRYRHETPIGHQPYMICHEADEAFERIDKALAQPAQKIPYPVTGWKVEVRGSNQRLFITGVYGDTIFVDLPEAQPAQDNHTQH